MGNEDISVGILAIFIHRSNHELYAFYQDQILGSPQKPASPKAVCDDTDFLMLKKRVMGGVSTKKFLVFRCLYRLRHLRER